MLATFSMIFQSFVHIFFEAHVELAKAYDYKYTAAKQFSKRIVYGVVGITIVFVFI